MAETQTNVKASQRGDVNDQPASPSRIKSDIDRTRAEMDRTIDQLGERLQPRQLMGEIMEMLTHTGRDVAGRAGDMARDTGKALWQTVRDNPLPTALIGTGLLYLALQRSGVQRRLLETVRRKRHPTDEEGTMVDTRTGELYGNDYGQEFATQVTGAAEWAQGAERARKTGKGYLQSARDRLAQAAEKMRSSPIAEQSGERLRQTASKAYEQLGRGSEKARHAIEEHPLAMGALAAGIGVVIGALLPRTRKESQWFGEQADVLKRQTGPEARASERRAPAPW